MPKPQGRCIFCGGLGLTKEHVLPDWMRAIFPRLPDDSHSIRFEHWPDVMGEVVDSRTIEHSLRGTRPTQFSRKVGQGHIGSKKIRAVCKACNNGWMGKLEEAAKPILEALIYGYPLNLGPSGQGVLARWIAKTTMTAEFMVPSQVAIKPWEREALRLSTQGLPHWQIWVGFYSGMELQSGGIFHHTVGLYHPSKVSIGVKNTQFTVLFLGRLFAFCISSENDRLAFQVGDEMKRAVRRLWPSDAAIVSWPPEASIDDRGAVALENMLGALLGTPVFGDA